MRLDKAMVVEGLARSRDQAMELIVANRVRVNGSIALKATRQIRPSDSVHILGPKSKYVGRGAYKLLGALDDLSIDLNGLTLSDFGSSTGGFTQVAIERGAIAVVAVDVGVGQMDQIVSRHPKVVLLEGVNVRNVNRDDFDLPHFDMVVGDLSFISLLTIADVVKSVFLENSGRFLLLVKPQFELDRRSVSRGKGVIRDPQLWKAAIIKVGQGLEERQARILAVVASRISGAQGNREFFIYGSFGDDELGKSQLAMLANLCVDSLIAETMGESEELPSEE
ncbi:TlyA family RNA methyltransferase [Acidithrix ferrooxidans]|uniref:16S/23S rRNA (Cytidine-2'-O)-methyltransferase TlyA n=1 Tax=Acidithrix ferrooxidans TaxID=1280514 RepID=A0A0D8HG13_9ACTN|nr:SAM-dependent methyltransferase [Acidithrix ferrooxidans]KJF16890.1 16S/23S rRNA (cytidine-2'-O)-methyltransferase TlyA [Acidithrix ferrooxidans]